ncbi:MAG: SDR family NAD(P)-dependent oxidoreductase, partial [Gammaproteobacteria bacterium]|nr:SDR family NAD(P)-dependent oxidoreductase [Gammaproteobacteria bacterium]
MILVTGGTGYIGSHTCIELSRAGFEVVVLDSLANSSSDVVGRLEQLTGKPTVFYEGDVRDEALLAKIFAEREVTGVIHFAGLKSLSDSLRDPLAYYSSNVAGTVAVLKAMQVAGCRTFIFSSSAT